MIAGKPAAPIRTYCPGRAETFLCWLVLAGLAAVAVGIGLRQASFNPAVLALRTAGVAQTAARAPDATGMPAELKTLGPAEQFSPDNLYDKIDGKAELYLAAGFVQLRSQRFALKTKPEEWLEWSVYDMGSLPQAFSVFSTQRRSEGQPLDLTPYAYRTRNGLYFVCGSDYVEAVGSSENDQLAKATLELGARFVGGKPGAQARLAGLEVFPATNLLPHSYVLQISDAFGFDQLKNVFTAQYKIGSAELTAFYTACTNQAAASSLSAAYRAFLLANGGKEAPAHLPATSEIEIMGGIEMFFAQAGFFAGVHAAPSAGPAEQLARELQQGLPGASSMPGQKQ